MNHCFSYERIEDDNDDDDNDDDNNMNDKNRWYEYSLRLFWQTQLTLSALRVRS
jgi:hypothetical protein